MHRVLLLAVVFSGCVYARTGVIGAPASRLAGGQAEAGIAAGVQYTSTAGGGSSTAGTAVQAATFQFPQLEANARYGLNETAELDVHVSPQGLIPGVKLGITAGAIDVAAMPIVGGGVFWANTVTSGLTTGGNTTYWDFLAGLRILASHSSVGVYGAFGYTFELSGNTTSSATTTGPIRQTGHTMSLAVGYDAHVGVLRIRPEVAGLMQVGITTTAGASSSGSSAMILTIMPTVTFAVASSSP